MTTSNNGNSVRTFDMKGGAMMAAHAQWAKRGPDETFTDLQGGYAAAKAHRHASRTAKIKAAVLRAIAQGDEVLLAGGTGKVATLTHHAFGQVASLAGAPASYLRKLPADLVASCINQGLAARAASRDDDDHDALLLRQDASGLRGLRGYALTSSRYARLWNEEVLGSLLDLQARLPYWTTPVAHRSAARVTGTGNGTAGWGADEGKRLSTVWVSDHDMFVLLTDQEHTVERRDGDGGVTRLFRGMIVENSEVGASSFRVTFFLYDAVCCNVIIWGVRDVAVISMRHVGQIRDVILGQGKVANAIAAFSNRSAREDEQRIAAAQRMLVADTQADVVSTLLGRRIGGLTETALDAAYTIAKETPRYGDPRSVWGIVNGLTEYSQRSPFADERVTLDRAAGKVLEIAF